MVNQTYDVLPHDKGWAVKRQDAKRPAKVFPNKNEAVRRGRELAKNNATALRVLDRQGHVQQEKDYWSDTGSAKRGRVTRTAGGRSRTGATVTAGPSGIGTSATRTGSAAKTRTSKPGEGRGTQRDRKRPSRTVGGPGTTGGGKATSTHANKTTRSTKSPARATRGGTRGATGSTRSGSKAPQGGLRGRSASGTGSKAGSSARSGRSGQRTGATRSGGTRKSTARRGGPAGR